MSLGRAEWPEVGELVVATVKRVEGYGAYVGLDEYKGNEGLLHISEISSRWVRNIRNHVRPGQKVVLQVMRTDPGKGQVDLSLRRVNNDEKRKKIEQWKKERKAETLLTQAAHELKMTPEALYEQEAMKIVEHYESLYTGLEAASKKGEEALVEAGVKPKVAALLSALAKDKIIIKGVTIQGIMEATAMSNRGIKDIKDTFHTAESVAKEHEASIQISTMGAPKYRITLSADDYKKAEYALDQVVKHTEKAWSDLEGSFSFTRE
ncbi:MAG: translation initiation factor IF-2 subunit alpha [Candidatus Bathyarchaeota archaeon]|nr:translation initiation factor IF-2 subunit alpha [Candidatus Bathyarchaeota archaeon]